MKEGSVISPADYPWGFFMKCYGNYFILQDEKYDHIESGDIDKVKKCLSEKSEWYEKNMNAQNQLKHYENPTVLASQIMSTKKVSDSRFA